MTNAKKKLRFRIRQIEFTDAQKYFQAIPGQQTTYTLELSRSMFHNISSQMIHNDCIAFSQLLQLKGIFYRDLKAGGDKNACGELEEDFVIVSFFQTKWETSVRIPPRSGGGEAKTRAVTQKTETMAEWLFQNGFSVPRRRTRARDNRRNHSG